MANGKQIKLFICDLLILLRIYYKKGTSKDLVGEIIFKF